MKFTELTLNPNNPSPFVQPFLVLHFQGDRSATEWYIDVGGQIDLYIKDWTTILETMRKMDIDDRGELPGVFNYLSQATPLLQDMMRELTENIRPVDAAYGYIGSAGPTHLLRNGAFFERISLRNEQSTATSHGWPDIATYLPKILSGSEA